MKEFCSNEEFIIGYIQIILDSTVWLKSVTVFAFSLHFHLIATVGTSVRIDVGEDGDLSAVSEGDCVGIGVGIVVDDDNWIDGELVTL